MINIFILMRFINHIHKTSEKNINTHDLMIKIVSKEKSGFDFIADI